MSKKQKKILVLAGAFALAFGIVPNVSAMHIMEGYLPGSFCIAWGVLCVPFLIAGFMSIKKTLNEHRNLITMLAMSGAFIFVISSLKIPSVTGSCSHMTGTGLGAILFGPAAVSILGADRSFCSRRFFWHTEDLPHLEQTPFPWLLPVRLFLMESMFCAKK